MRLPTSTYRLQFHRDFPLGRLPGILPYLRRLGIDTVYASPILTANAGSNHGYDVTDPGKLNPEVTDEDTWAQIHKELIDSEVYWMQDIVPNHTALSPVNSWLLDVLEHGENSRYYRHFDIDWNHPELPGRLLLPVLGENLDAVLQAGHIKVADGKLHIYDKTWPLLAGTDTSRPLREIIEAQVYAPDDWQRVNDFINYRRFFTVNELICMRTEEQTVFDDLHARTLRDVRAGHIDHLRIDHVDGLLDPTTYLQRLREAVGPDVGIYVEKILEPGEQLPESWPVQGTTGYDFLAAVNRLLTNDDSGNTFSNLYEQLTDEPLPDYQQLVFENKLMLVHEHFNGELDNLTRLWEDLLPAELIPADQLRPTLAAWLAGFPVYRIYPTGGALSSADLLHCQEAAIAVTHYAPEYSRGALALNYWLAQQDFSDPEALRAVQRSQQLSGPLMAKGVEDTTFYQFWRQAHLNEVGGTADPQDRLPVRAFHRFIQSRPVTTMNATATHDTKRGEDARARLQALTFFPGEWRAFVETVRTRVRAKNIHPRALYLVLQSLMASYPLHKPATEADLKDRLHRYLEKALREGKELSDWANPDVEYERNLNTVADHILDDPELVAALEKLLKTIWAQARHHSFAQTLLKCTVPGFPDIYQGTESWDLSLVDPDNRRPVDYDKRLRWLDRDDVDTYHPAQKAQLLAFLLNLRREHAEFFARADYEPLAEGDHTLAFRRSYGGKVLTVRVAKEARTQVGGAESGAGLARLPQQYGKALDLLLEEGPAPNGR